MNDRTCIITRESGTVQNLIRFVAGPDGAVVPDLKANLPGRGAWVKAQRIMVEEAMRRKAFQRALRADVTVDPGLPDLVDRLLLKAALQSLAMARKAGEVTTGALKVDAAIRTGKVTMILHASEAAEDGKRKLAQAVHAAKTEGVTSDMSVVTAFNSEELGHVFGDQPVTHVALLQGALAASFIERTQKLLFYREKND